ncbi:protein FAM13A-like [Notothenia coriiceps]|uniref:Protein FAM13A-like n=1 Tax=Notothenia coriiceps TaxID=8208 RepID=A0A6I9PJP5_9TELE|nr:PREDICTED: protein FAM13A-like [Notothenia coriiceps]
MGASASVSLCSDTSSVSILRPSAKVSPEPPALTLVSKPELSTRCVFAVALETLREEGQMVDGIPVVLRDMVEFLDNNGLHHRGLFRLCGSAVRTRQLRQRSDCGERVDMEHEGDIPTVASLLKLFLRELPIAIVPEPQRKQLVLSLKEWPLTENIITCLWKIWQQSSGLAYFMFLQDPGCWTTRMCVMPCCTIS